MSQVFVREDRLPSLDGKLAELVWFRPSYRIVLADGTSIAQDGLQVDVRVIETGEVWCGVWASRCTPRTRLARELLEAHGPGGPRSNRR